MKNVNTVELRLNSRDNNFDIIRFLAAISVIYAHSFPLTAGLARHDSFMIFTRNYLNLGTLAVVFFFIISGFLITSSYHRSKSIKSFCVARLLRIYPGLIIVVFFTVFIIGPLFTKISLGSYFSNLFTYSYLQNCLSLNIIQTLPGVFERNPISVVNGSLWSLPYELSCYCLIACIGLLLNKKYKSFFVIFSFLLIIYFSIGLKVWTNIVQYSLYFMLGALVYLFRKKVYLNPFLAILFLCIFIVTLHLNIHKHLKDIVLCLTLPYIIINAAFIKSPLNNFAKHGDFSYGIYIWGYLVQQILILYFPDFSPFLNFIIASFITLILAFISWHFIEKKALMLKKRFI